MDKKTAQFKKEAIEKQKKDLLWEKNHKILFKLEKVVHKLIPFCLVILLFVIISEIFFNEWAHHHELYIKGLDYIVIFIFIIDLVVKYVRMKDIPKFLKTSWIDIIAVFPFFLIFRLIQEATALIKAGEVVQTTFHEVIEMEKAAKILKESSKGSKVLKEASMSVRFIRPLLRIPRFVKALSFFNGKNKIRL